MNFLVWLLDKVQVHSDNIILSDQHVGLMAKNTILIYTSYSGTINNLMQMMIILLDNTSTMMNHHGPPLKELLWRR